MRSWFSRLALAAGFAASMAGAAVAQSRVDQLTAGAAVSGTDLLPNCQGCGAATALVKTSMAQVLTFVQNNSAPTLGSTPLPLGQTTTAVTGLASLGITAPAANTAALTISGASHTGSDATSDFSLATTLNTSGALDVFKVVATVTSGASAKLLNLYGGAGGATSEFSVSAGGAVSAAGTITAGSSLVAGAATNITWSGRGVLTSPGANIVHIGPADAASSVAQTLGVQSVVAGTSNTAGTNFTIAGSQGTGTGAGGSVIIQIAPAGSTGTAQNALAAALTIDSTKRSLFAGHIVATSTAPSISACGTGSPTISGGDNFGQVVAGTVATTCVINFGTTWGTAPSCQVSSSTAIASLTVATSTTQLTIGGAALGGDTIAWSCGSTARLGSKAWSYAANDNESFQSRFAGVYRRHA